MQVALVVAIVLPVYYGMAYVLSRLFRPYRWLVGLAALLLLCLFSLGYAYVCVYVILPWLKISWPVHEMAFDLPQFMAAIGVFFIRLLIYAVVIESLRRVADYYVDRARARKALADTMDAFLRFQINAHLQFNLLSTMSKDARKRDDQRAVAITAGLTKLTQYSLDIANGKQSRVSVLREKDALATLVQLVQLDHSGLPAMEFEVRGRYCGQLVPPAVFLTAAENALRYGVVSADCPAWLLLELHSDGFVFTCRNRIDPDPVESGTGHGLRNIRERLEILFSGRHQLTAEEKNNDFEFYLRIWN